MSVVLISGSYFIKLVHLPVLSILSPGPDFSYLSPGPDFIKLVRVQNLSVLSPGPDPGLIKAVRKASPVQILLIFKSGSGFYPSSPDPGPDFIKHVRVRVQVRILPIPTRPIYFLCFVLLTI